MYVIKIQKNVCNKNPKMYVIKIQKVVKIYLIKINYKRIKEGIFVFFSIKKNVGKSSIVFLGILILPIYN